MTMPPHRLLLANPRGFCAGVERAIDTVGHVLDCCGPPVYVRREIVHNAHVIDNFRQKGVVFVEEVSDVPEGGLVILSAHGVSPQVRAQAAARRLTIIDATY